MSKAEERAQAAYPTWRNGIGDEFSSNSAYYGFIKGYNQAEKDLELTLEDVKLFLEVSYEIFTEVENGSVDYTSQQFFEKVLKCFKERRVTKN